MLHCKERSHSRDYCASCRFGAIISTGRPRGSKICLEEARGAVSAQDLVKQTAAQMKALRLKAKER